jgi:DnaK suppressor protein
MTSRSALASQLDAAQSQLAQLTRDLDGMMLASQSSNADDEHDPEGSTIAFEREQLSTVAQHVRSRISGFEQALVRIESGTYGICVSCGGPIAAGRLDARPDASTCIACAQ